MTTNYSQTKFTRDTPKLHRGIRNTHTHAHKHALACLRIYAFDTEWRILWTCELRWCRCVRVRVWVNMNAYLKSFEMIAILWLLAGCH